MRSGQLLRRITLTIGILVSGGLGAPPASGPGPASRLADVANLIRNLDSDSWRERESAQAELARRGGDVAAALKEALASGRMGLEGRTRAEWVLAQVDVPECGAVWRDNPHRRAPEGMQDGDVIISCNGRPVLGRADAWRAAAAYGDATLVVWRRGHGNFSLEGPHSTLALRLSSTWPDHLELFNRFAKGEKFDDHVRAAIRLHGCGDPNSAGLFSAGWDAGCRSLMIATIWLEELREAGRLAEAGKVWKEEFAGASEKSPGGLWQYGMLPYERATVEIASGRLTSAAQILEDALAAALKADAFLAVPVLRYAQAEIKVYHGPLQEATTFWRTHAEEINRGERMIDTNLSAMLAGRLAAEGDPGPALEFAKALPESIGKDLLVEYYAAQVERAKNVRLAKPDLPNWVLVQAVPLVAPGPAALSRYTSATVARLRLPARMDARMRLASFPPDRTQWMRVGNVELSGGDAKTGGRQQSGLIFRLYSDGRIKSEPLEDPVAMRVWGSRAFDPNAWIDVSLEVRPEVLRTRVGGKPFRAVYPPSPGPDGLLACAGSSGARAEFRDVRLYQGTAAVVNNAAIEEQLLLLGKAQRAGDLKLAREAADKVLAEWRKASEANETSAAVRSNLRRLEQFLSPQGQNVCVPESLAAVDQRGQWGIEEDALVGRAGADSLNPSIAIPVPYRNFECTGYVEVPEFAKDTQAVMRFGAVVNGPVRLFYLPSTSKLWLGGPGEKVFVGNIQVPPGGAGFCLRVLGGKAVLFVGNGQSPPLKMDKIEFPGDNLVLSASRLPRGGLVRFRRLVFRALPTDATLAAPPATMPGAAPARP